MGRLAAALRERRRALVRFLAIPSLLAATGPAALAAVTEEITGIVMEPPPSIMDSDELDGDSATIRHGLLAPVQISISRDPMMDPDLIEDYRVVYCLENAAGTKLELAPGGVFEAAAPPFHVELIGTDGDYLALVNAVPDPLATLDPADRYRVKARLERDDAGTWTAVDTESTALTPVLHFTNTASGDAVWNIRGLLLNLAWERKFLIDTDGAHDALQADVSALVGRYDDFDDAVAAVAGTIIFDFDLLDSGSNSVPLENDGVVTQVWNADSYDDSGARPLPVTATIAINNLELKPLVQLDSVNQAYVLRCTLRHVEDALAGEHTDMAQSLAAEQLLHFNGNLLFGAFLTTFTSIQNAPAPLGNGATWVDTQLAITPEAGVLPGNPNYVFGDGTTLGVRLLANGDAELDPAVVQSQAVHPPGNPAGEIDVSLGCIEVEYTGGVTLFRDGAAGGAQAESLTIRLPQGLGYIEDTTVSAYRGSSTYFHAAPPVDLGPNLNPSGPVTITLGANAAVFDESHPLVFRTGQCTLDPAGALDFDLSDVEYIHDAALTAIEAPTLMVEDASMRERFSNDLYLRTAQSTAAAARWTAAAAAADKSARLTTQLAIAPTAFHAHFPRATRIETLSASLLAVADGVPQSAASELVDVAPVEVPYTKNCPDDDKGCPADGTEIVMQTPDGDRLTQTPTGGLWRHGTVANVRLQWGARGDMGGALVNFAHETDPFGEANFYMPGYQLYAGANPLLVHDVFGSSGGDHAPTALLLAAFNENPSTPALHLPTDSSYVSGDGSYGGLNFSVTAAGFGGLSRLGGDPAGFAYELLETNNASKYYIRESGVSGRQVAIDGTWSDPVSIYGFAFDFTSFQLSFLSSAPPPEGSRVDGEIVIAGYSNFSQEFTGLEIDCLGELTGAEIDPNDLGDKALTYWNSVFQPKWMSFSTQELVPGACPLENEAVLVMGVATQVAHVPATLHGIFGFHPDGNLATPADGFPGINVTDDIITCELGLPPLLTLSGPNKDYSLVPTGKLRFNNPAEAGHAIGSTLGFVTWGAIVDIPFFTDLQVQCITSAPPTPAAPFYLAPGWDEGGKTFFGNKDFDPSHKSWPIGMISLSEYQNPDPATDDQFLVHAAQSIFGAIDLDYPLDWDDNLRRFKSIAHSALAGMTFGINRSVIWSD